MHLARLLLLTLCLGLYPESKAAALTPLKPSEYLDKISELAGIPWSTLRDALLDPTPAHVGALRVTLIRSSGTEQWKTESRAIEQTLRSRVETACKAKDRDGDPCGAAKEELRRFREMTLTLSKASKKKGRAQTPSLTVLAALLFARSMKEEVLPREEALLNRDCPPKTTYTPPKDGTPPSACELYRAQLKKAVHAVMTAVDLSWAQVTESPDRAQFEKELKGILQNLDAAKGI